MHFGENQLSRSLIGLSPLPTAHPLHFQLKWVRSSTRSYTRFNLAMGRSPGFASTARHCRRPCQTRFRSGCGYHSLNLATDGNSPVRSTKSTPSPGPSKGSPGSDSMSAHGFRISFTPLDGVLFTIPSRYCSLSVARGIEPWRVVPPASSGMSRVPPYSRIPTRANHLSPTGLSPFSRPLPAAFG